MPNVAAVLKDEISRVARKEIRSATDTLRKASTEYRKKIAEMNREISELQRKVKLLEKQLLKQEPSQTGEADAGNFRFSAKGLRSNRKRLGLSAADYGKLIGVTGQTVYKWEQEKTRPRSQQMGALASLREMGKKEVQMRLAHLAESNPQTS